MEDPDEAAGAYAAMVELLGWTAAQRQLGVRINVGRAPTHNELVQAVRRDHLSLIRLQPA